MRYYPLAKNLGKVLLLALIPILLVIRFWWDAILPFIIYLQFLLIWAQAEIGLRQHALFSAQFDPSFDVKLTRIEGRGVIDKETDTVLRRLSISIRNLSKNPAYNIMVGRMLDVQNEPIPPNNWKDKVSSDLIGSLAPGQEVLLCSLDEDIVKNKPAIEVSYTNQFGEWKEICIKFLKDETLLLIPKEIQKSGILLNTFEDLTLFLKFIKFERHLKSQKQSKLETKKKSRKD
jgi:hypothetical protein